MTTNETPLHAGRRTDFASSMAEAMEKELNTVRSTYGLPALPLGNPQTRILFLAIARGIVKHLKEREKAFSVDVTGQDPGHGHIVIATTGAETQ